ncbi:unnamed protein product [Owenia fusiformis]|uniref:Zinc finger Ran-binding domain-containing protein 2 n=1 Tax=Owenia fusiformis TaxID=6347 RepID=A0A8J1TQD7_OWEFU|nr:unnamed protein product [Owenia fusiformis]
MYGRGNRPGDSDWVCSDGSCGNVNFSRRTSCNRCGKDRDYDFKKTKKGGIEIGKSMAEKSKGLFSADDWQCKTCGNVNWARRNTCNVCNSPKVGKVEERSGLGGGYMEREVVVEYKDRVEVEDDDYDEFGRLKKKKRTSVDTAPVAPPPVEDEEDEAEEEEDDDDDEDVSKYMLDSDDDDDDKDTSKYDLASDDDKPNNLSKSRSPKSRSRSSSSSSSSSSRSSSSRSRSRSRSPYYRDDKKKYRSRYIRKVKGQKE